jgi:GNAT superfamily N-acetyltransferase
MITIKRTNSDDLDFQELVKLLDRELQERDGEEHLFYATLNKTKTLNYVLVAYDQDEPIGCGALRNYSNDTMEVKRMFVPLQKRRQGIASTILAALEIWCKELGIKKCILETGKNQPEAIALYKKNHYNIIPNFGKYEGVENSVCFEKEL